MSSRDMSAPLFLELASDALRRAGLYSAPLSFIPSTSNHLVATDGQFFMKAPEVGSPSADRLDVEFLVVRELKLYPALRLSLADGRPLLVTENLGSRPEELTSANVSELADLALSLHPRFTVALSAGLSRPDQWASEMWDRIAARLSLVSDPVLSGLVSEVASELLSSAEELRSRRGGWSSLVFSHGDLSMNNSVVGHRGLQLVDWESARWAPVEWDAACLWYMLKLRSRPELWPSAAFRFPTLDPELLLWSLQVKAATSLSFAAWRVGPRTVSRRLPLVLKILSGEVLDEF